MPDKMIRMAGRGQDGTAKAISVDNEGRIRLKGSRAIKYSHTYIGQTGAASSYFYAENKTQSTVTGHKTLDVRENDKTVIVYKNNTDKIRRLRVMLLYEAPTVTASAPEAGISPFKIKEINIARVAVNETLIITPRSLDEIYGYKELDYPFIGLTVNATYHASSGINQSVNGTEEIVILSR